MISNFNKFYNNKTFNFNFYKMVKDYLLLSFHIDIINFSISESTSELFHYLSDSILPSPTLLTHTGKPVKTIFSFNDPQIINYLKIGKHVTEIYDNNEMLNLSIIQNRHDTIISLKIDIGLLIEKKIDNNSIIELFKMIINYFPTKYAFCHLDHHLQKLNHKYYQFNFRSFYIGGLYWLNYLGQEESALQGGDLLLENRWAECSRFNRGYLIKVGNTPFESNTPEGETLLVNATNELPEMQVESDEVKPEYVTLNGIEGFFDYESNEFWVSKHLSENSKLDIKTIDELKTIVGLGKPSVNKVNILFSRKQTAMINKDILFTKGIGVWYIDPETGQPAILG